MILSKHLASIARHFQALVQFRPLPHDRGVILKEIRSSEGLVATELAEVRSLSEKFRATAVLLNGNLNYSFDVQGLLMELKPSLSRSTRLIAIVYNPYLRLIYRMANALGLRQAPLPPTFLTRTDITALASLSGYEVVSLRYTDHLFARLIRMGTRWDSILCMTPVLRHLALSSIVVLRPIIREQTKPGLTILIPARNERGNIEAAIKRLPDMGCPIEVIFVEGHSSDNTWEEIERVKEKYGQTLKIVSLQQTGKGKADAVRLGFSVASMPLLTILDADLTMPPELLPRFYDAYVHGLGDFINGNRLVYPMEGEAMRFLNLLGNIFFAKALSWTLGVTLGDSLCGTKLMHKEDYERMTAWRKNFGEFDPFGDFELLFPAAQFSLGIVNIPIRYLDRTYGSTNISRFRHGFQLLRMVIVGLFRIKIS